MWSSSAPAIDVRVGIVTPAYNAAATLARTIASVQAQTLRAWRHVIVDDGSSDASLAIAEGFARRDLRITVLSQANGGPAAARNLGLAHIDAPWVYFLDADDWIAPTFLERALRIAARRQPAPDVVMLGYWSVDQHGRRIARHWPPEMSDPRAAQEALAALAATDGAPRVLALAPGDWTALVAALAARAGFTLTLEAQHGFAQAGDDPMRTPRIRAGALEAPETIVTRLRPSRL